VWLDLFSIYDTFKIANDDIQYLATALHLEDKVTFQWNEGLGSPEEYKQNGMKLHVIALNSHVIEVIASKFVKNKQEEGGIFFSTYDTCSHPVFT